MKHYTYLFIALILFASSCKIPQYGNKPRFEGKPYVELRDGTKHDGTNVEVKYDRVIVDSAYYYREELKKVWDGEYWYQKIGKKGWAVQDFEGKLNIWHERDDIGQPLYAPKYVVGKPMKNINGQNLFIQHENTFELIPLNYKSISEIIRPEDAGYREVVGYKRSRNTCNTIRWAGLGLLPISFIAPSLHFINPLSSGAVSVLFMLSGIVASLLTFTIASSVKKHTSRKKILNAVDDYNSGK